MFDLIDDYAGVVAYTSYDTATFTNAGLLEKTGGTAASAIYATVTNTGSIAVASGVLVQIELRDEVGRFVHAMLSAL